MKRRDFLADSGMLLAGALVGSTARAQSATRLIDVHHHYIPDFYRKTQETRGQLPDWTPQISLERMDRDGMATAILSISNPGAEDPGNPSNTPRLCRQVNDYGAKLVADRPERFGLFASLPLPDVDAALKEIAYAYDTLHADGIVFMSHFGEAVYPGHQRLNPVMEELNRRNAVVFIHPRSSFYAPRGGKSPLDDTPGVGSLELPIGTGRAMFSMWTAGTLEKYPNIRFIAAHAGGVALMMHSRVTFGMASTMSMKEAHRRVSQFLRGFYYDFALAFQADIIKHVQNVADPSKVLFGTDFPFVRAPNMTREMVEELRGAYGARFNTVERLNSEALFPRLKQS